MLGKNKGEVPGMLATPLGRGPDSPQLQLHPSPIEQDGGCLVVNSWERGDYHLDVGLAMRDSPQLPSIVGCWVQGCLTFVGGFLKVHKPRDETLSAHLPSREPLPPTVLPALCAVPGFASYHQPTAQPPYLGPLGLDCPGHCHAMSRHPGRPASTHGTTQTLYL